MFRFESFDDWEKRLNRFERSEKNPLNITQEDFDEFIEYMNEENK